jgi:hypothetical protein
LETGRLAVNLTPLENQQAVGGERQAAGKCAGVFGLLLSAFCLLHFLMDRMVAARAAKLLQLQPVLILLLVLRRCIVAVLAVTALQSNNFAHRSLLTLNIQPSAWR